MAGTGEILDDFLGVFCLASTGFSSDQDALVFTLVNKVAESLVGHGEYVRLRVFSASALVHIDILVGVNGQRAVRIHGDQEEARVGIDEVCLVSHVQVVDDGCLVEMCQLGHVVCFVELGRVDFIHAFAIDLTLLERRAWTYAAIVALDEKPAPFQLLDDPALDEGGLRIPQPDISLSRKVVLALDAPHDVYASPQVLGLDEGGRKDVQIDDRWD
ncbi:hypothetical protein GGS24DRAFT_492490 [Hypoxylon argillaceum]|nr:hypothetical protein GGS24DRAFT_492490 [Hypoxylon argillaceum]